ncbi:protein kinase, partial [Candidatus Woesearchaeota archaeon]|nr:protein kinase [Candidatus Woesearchaeota archaeon]
MVSAAFIGVGIEGSVGFVTLDDIIRNHKIPEINEIFINAHDPAHSSAVSNHFKSEARNAGIKLDTFGEDEVPPADITFVMLDSSGYGEAFRQARADAKEKGIDWRKKRKDLLDRVMLAKNFLLKNTKPTIRYAENYGKADYKGNVVVVTNLTDYMAYLFQAYSGLAKVFAFNCPDSRRLKTIVSEELHKNNICKGLREKDIVGYAGGQHGPNMFPIFKSIKLRVGEGIEFLSLMPHLKEKVKQESIEIKKRIADAIRDYGDKQMWEFLGTSTEVSDLVPDVVRAITKGEESIELSTYFRLQDERKRIQSYLEWLAEEHPEDRKKIDEFLAADMGLFFGFPVSFDKGKRQLADIDMDIDDQMHMLKCYMNMYKAFYEFLDGDFFKECAGVEPKKIWAPKQSSSQTIAAKPYMRKISRYYVDAKEKPKQGSMSNVFTVFDDDGNKFAAKVTSCSKPKDEEKFKREIEILQQLAGHPHIINCYESGQDGRDWYSILELGDYDLEERIVNGDKVVDVKEAASICADICSALSAAHKKGIVHGDIKPNNVLVVKAGGNETVKLSDFGSSKLVSRLQQTSLLAPKHEGTAPEVMNAADYNLTTSIDIY